MKFVVDAAIIAILLFTIFTGYRKGAIGGLLGLAFVIGNVVLSFWLAKYLTQGLLKTSLGGFINTWVEGWFSKGNTSQVFYSTVITSGDGIFLLFDGISVPLAEALATIKVPAFIIPTVVKALSSVAVSGVSLSSVLVPMLSYLFLQICSIVLLLIVIGIVFKIVNISIGKFVKQSLALTKIDNLLGALVGFVKGAIFVLVTLLVLNIFANISFMQGFFNAIKSSFFGGFIYKINLLEKVMIGLSGLTNSFIALITPK